MNKSDLMGKEKIAKRSKLEDLDIFSNLPGEVSNLYPGEIQLELCKISLSNDHKPGENEELRIEAKQAMALQMLDIQLCNSKANENLTINK